MIINLTGLIYANEIDFIVFLPTIKLSINSSNSYQQTHKHVSQVGLLETVYRYNSTVYVFDSCKVAASLFITEYPEGKQSNCLATLID